jgi:DUF1009 family protein
MEALQDKLSELTSPFGIVAGNGRFPIEIAESARSRGLSVAVVAIKGEADPLIESLADRCTWVGLGQLGKLIKTLCKAGVKQVAFAGGITRVNFVTGFSMDWRAIKMLSSLKSFNDDSILRGIISEIESSGMTVVAASLLLDKSVPKAGVITKRTLNESEKNDARIGWEAARAIGGLDIGQSVVVRNKTVIAVEAVEGTDATVSRAGSVRGDGGVLIKLAKPIQDLRIDLPTIGVKTIELMKQNRLTAVVVEAGRSIILDPQAVIEEAQRHQIAIIAVEGVEQLT